MNYAGLDNHWFSRTLRVLENAAAKP